MFVYYENYGALHGMPNAHPAPNETLLAGYSPSVEPLSVATQASARLLIWPDHWREPAEWQPFLGLYLQAFTADDDVALLLRYDPESDAAPAEHLAQSIEALLAKLDIDAGEMPEMLIVDDPLGTTELPSLFTAATHYLRCDGQVTDDIHAERAARCGLYVMRAESPAALRFAVLGETSRV